MVLSFQVYKPIALRTVLGKTEVKETLKTSNHRQAILLPKELSVKAEKAFQDGSLTMIGTSILQIDDTKNMKKVNSSKG
jgi:hypothetical protein